MQKTAPAGWQPLLLVTMPLHEFRQGYDGLAGAIADPEVLASREGRRSAQGEALVAELDGDFQLSPECLGKGAQGSDLGMVEVTTLDA